MATRSISGRRAKIFVNDTEVGFCTGISATETQGLTRVDACGDSYSKEITVNGRATAGTVNFVRIFKGSAKALGFMARGDTVSILNFPPVNLVIFDTIEDTPLETITGAVFENRSWQLDAAGVITSQAGFQAIKMLDEDEL